MKATNICGGVKVVPVVLSGQTYSFTFAPGCEPIVQGRIDLAPTDDWRYTESHFLIQQLNEATQVWETRPHTGLSLNQKYQPKSD